MSHVQRLLQDDISQLRYRLGELEKKSFELSQQERRVAKRSQDNDQNPGSQKKLKSTVEVKAIIEPLVIDSEPESRPLVQTSERDRGRNRRLFGNLLMGTLSKFKEETTQKPDDQLSKRLEIEKEIEQRVEKDHENLVLKEKNTLLTKRQEIDSELSELKTSLESKEKELKDYIYSSHNSNYCYYAMTTSEPRVYFRPKKLDEWSSKTFRFTIPEEEMKVEETVNGLDMALQPEVDEVQERSNIHIEHEGEVV